MTGAEGGGGGSSIITDSEAPPDPPPQALSPIKPAKISDDPNSFIFNTISPIKSLFAPLAICVMAGRCYVKAGREHLSRPS